jgi:hypothetical protein
MNTLSRVLSAAALLGFIATGVSDHAAAATTPKTSSKGFGIFVSVGTASTIALSGNTTFTWNGVKSSMQSYQIAQSGPLTVTGGIRTSPSGGAASIVVMSPANIAGQNKVNNTLAINELALTCSGSGNVGTQPTYAPALTKLKASSTVPCASWGPAATTRLNFTFALYLQTQNSPQDVYKSQGFSIIATAT